MYSNLRSIVYKKNEWKSHAGQRIWIFECAFVARTPRMSNLTPRDCTINVCSRVFCFVVCISVVVVVIVLNKINNICFYCRFVGKLCMDVVSSRGSWFNN